MFDKCTIYTVYNRDDYPQIPTPPNEFNSNRIYPFKQPSSLSVSLNDYNNNHQHPHQANTLLTTIHIHHHHNNRIHRRHRPSMAHRPAQYHRNNFQPIQTKKALWPNISTFSD